MIFSRKGRKETYQCKTAKSVQSVLYDSVNCQIFGIADFQLSPLDGSIYIAYDNPNTK